HATATPLFGPGCTAADFGGSLNVRIDTSLSVVLTRRFGQSGSPRQPWTPLKPATSRTGLAISRYSPLSGEASHCRSAYACSPLLFANSGRVGGACLSAGWRYSHAASRYFAVSVCCALANSA